MSSRHLAQTQEPCVQHGAPFESFGDLLFLEALPGSNNEEGGMDDLWTSFPPASQNSGQRTGAHNSVGSPRRGSARDNNGTNSNPTSDVASGRIAPQGFVGKIRFGSTEVRVVLPRISRDLLGEGRERESCVVQRVAGEDDEGEDDLVDAQGVFPNSRSKKRPRMVCCALQFLCVFWRRIHTWALCFFAAQRERSRHKDARKAGHGRT